MTCCQHPATCRKHPGPCRKHLARCLQHVMGCFWHVTMCCVLVYQKNFLLYDLCFARKSWGKKGCPMVNIPWILKLSLSPASWPTWGWVMYWSLTDSRQVGAILECLVLFKDWFETFSDYYFSGYAANLLVTGDWVKNIYRRQFEDSTFRNWTNSFNLILSTSFSK